VQIVGARLSYERGSSEAALVEQTIGDFFDVMARSQQERMALVSRHENRRLGHGQLRDEVHRLASGLLRQQGSSPATESASGRTTTWPGPCCSSQLRRRDWSS
jgi:hypothetical protein